MLKLRVQPPTNTNGAAAEGPKRYYGKLEASEQLVCLVKGVGRVPYDPSDPAQAKKRAHVAVTIAVHCEKRDGDPYTIGRTMLVEDKQQPDWRDVTLPSLEMLGVPSLDSLNGAWACVELVPVGTWIGRDGIERTRTAIKVVALFDTETAMHAARRGHGRGEPTAEVPAPTVRPTRNTPQAMPAPAPNAAQRQQALAMLPALIEAAEAQGGSITANLEKLMAGIPIFAKAGVSIGDEDVQALLNDGVPF